MNLNQPGRVYRATNEDQISNLTFILNPTGTCTITCPLPEHLKDKKVGCGYSINETLNNFNVL